MPDVTDVLQRYTFDCGPACVEMVARAFGRRVPRVRCSRSNGTEVDAVCEAFGQCGLRSVEGRMDEADVRYHLGRGRLVMCVVPAGNESHWVLLSRVRRGRVRVHDPSAGRSEEPVADFTRRWRRRGCVAVAVGPAGLRPAVVAA